MRNAYKISFGDLKGNNSFVRQRRTWEDNWVGVRSKVSRCGLNSASLR